MESDKEYIEKIIRNYERRNIRAALFGVVGVIFAVAAYLVYVELGEKTHEVVSSILSVLKEGQQITGGDIKLIEVNNELSFVMGLRVGQMMQTCAAVSSISLGYCLYLLFWARKERIIIELYKKVKK